MAEPIDESAFWLPSEFLTEDDFLFMAKESSDFDNKNKNSTKGFTAPNAFLLPPNNGGFGLFRSSSALNSPGESVVSSTETESNDDPDEFIAELTRHLAQSAIRERSSKAHHPQEKSWGALATSPQSTLSGFASWTNTNRCPGANGSPPNAPSQVRSPPAFEANNDEAWELIYAAAERVARMRKNSQAQMMNQQASRGVLSAPCNASSAPLEGRTPPACYNVPQNNQFQMKTQVKQGWLCQQQMPSRGGGRLGGGGEPLFECGNGRCGGNGTALGLPQSAWPPLRAQQQINHHHLNHACAGGCNGVVGGGNGGSGMRAVFLGGSGPAGVKRQSTGTGVFLPRRVGSNTTIEPRKKQGCSTVLLPARVVQALNLNIDEMNGHTYPCVVPNHDILVARRNALMAQQRRSLRAERPISHHEVPLLPQEWTY